jgi:hypothetical protein
LGKRGEDAGVKRALVDGVHDAEGFHFGRWLSLDIAPSSKLSKASRTRVQFALEISKSGAI